MRIPLSGRPVVAAVLALYALAAGVILPLHSLLDTGHGTTPTAAAEAAPGEFLDAGCPGGPCGVPGHHHRPFHSHDPATCVKCAAARALGVAVAVADAPAPLLPAAGRATDREPRPAPAARPAAFLARGPPLS